MAAWAIAIAISPTGLASRSLKRLGAESSKENRQLLRQWCHLTQDKPVMSVPTKLSPKPTNLTSLIKPAKRVIQTVWGVDGGILVVMPSRASELPREMWSG